MMKTLVKPQAKFTQGISSNYSYRQNRTETSSFQYTKHQRQLKYILIAMSFFTFVVVSDSPVKDAEICNRYNSHKVCNIW